MFNDCTLPIITGIAPFHLSSIPKRSFTLEGFPSPSMCRKKRLNWWTRPMLFALSPSPVDCVRTKSNRRKKERCMGAFNLSVQYLPMPKPYLWMAVTTALYVPLLSPVIPSYWNETLATARHLDYFLLSHLNRVCFFFFVQNPKK